MWTGICLHRGHEVWDSIMEDFEEESADAPELSTKLKQMLTDSDANKDGTINKPELSAFIQGAQKIMDEMDMQGTDEDASDEEELDYDA